MWEKKKRKKREKRSKKRAKKSFMAVENFPHIGASARFCSIRYKKTARMTVSGQLDDRAHCPLLNRKISGVP
jgi:hypothetical protein